MTWTAIVPLKAAADRKTRLAGVLADDEHLALTADMAAHVMATLASVGAITAIHVLSPVPDDMPGALWVRDLGKGMNAELDRVCAGLEGQRVLLIHADLPLLHADDVSALLAAAEEYGAAIAPDRHGKGTNALAMRSAVHIGFAFGVDSYARHLQRLPGAATIVRDGLAIDIDTAEDIAAAAGSRPL